MHVREEFAFQVGEKFGSVKESKAGATASGRGGGPGGRGVASAKARPC